MENLRPGIPEKADLLKKVPSSSRAGRCKRAKLIARTTMALILSWVARNWRRLPRQKAPKGQGYPHTGCIIKCFYIRKPDYMTLHKHSVHSDIRALCALLYLETERLMCLEVCAVRLNQKQSSQACSFFRQESNDTHTHTHAHTRNDALDICVL